MSSNTSTTDSTQADPSPLKRLPAELRNQIFLLAVAEPEPIQLQFQQYAKRQPSIPIQTHPTRDTTGLALAQTCRQFREETKSMPFAVNTFALELPLNQQLLKSSMPSYLNLAPQVIINIDDFDDYAGVIIDAGQIHIQRQPDSTLQVSATGTLEHRCICDVEALTKECSGEDAMTRFITQFEHRSFRQLYRCSRAETESTALIASLHSADLCDECGKTETPRSRYIDDYHRKPFRGEYFRRWRSGGE